MSGLFKVTQLVVNQVTEVQAILLVRKKGKMEGEGKKERREEKGVAL